MNAAANAKSLTVRLRPTLYEAATSLAKRRRLSLNALIQESLEEILRIEEEREMYEAATLLGEDPDECDVEYAFAAQAEVALRDAP